MLSLLVLACSTQTGVVVPLQENGLEPPPEILLTPAPKLDLPSAATACAWPDEDPGDLEETGAKPGDVVANVTLWDQCGEPLPLWDLHGRYVLLYLTTFACEECEAGATKLPYQAMEIEESAGVDEILPVVVVHETEGLATARSSGRALAEELGLGGFPVTADAEGDTATALPWKSGTFPGWCVLAPDMTILGCSEDPVWNVLAEDWITLDAAER